MLFPSIVARNPRKIVVAVLSVGLAAAVACGGSSPTAPVLVAAGNTTVPMDPAVTSAVVGTTFSFPGGAGAFSSTAANQDLTLSFGGTSTALTSSGTITSPTGTPIGSFTSSVSFGSCDFKILTVTGTPGFNVGDVIRVDPCTLNIGTNGVAANNQSESTSATLVIGTQTSAKTPVTVQVSSTGTVTVNGQQVATVTVHSGSSASGGH